MIAATIVSTFLAAMPAATGDVTTTSSIAQFPPDAARGAITARRRGAQRAPKGIDAGRQPLARWRCALVGRSIRCTSSRRVKAARRAYRVRATYVSFGGRSRKTTTVVFAGRTK